MVIFLKYKYSTLVNDYRDSLDNLLERHAWNTVNREIFNSNKFSRLVDSTKI